MTAPTPRGTFDAIPHYRAGIPAPDDAFKLSSNENPYDPLPSVLEAAQRELARFNRYPDAGLTELYAALSARFGLPAENFAVGNGSVAVLFNLLHAVCTDGDEVIYPWRSFEAYPISVQLTGATSIRVPLKDDGRHDLDAMLAAVTPHTKVILVCTPNNPTGPAVTTDELTAFLTEVPATVLVILDEAYLEFARDEHTASGLQFFASFDNVVLLRTFSKAYGLAGLRVGYAIASVALAAAIRKVTPPFSVIGVAQAAAVASLHADAELLERVDAVVLERDRVVAELRAQGWVFPDSEANFVWLPLGPDAEGFAATCTAAGVSVRTFAGEGVRVTIGAAAANDAFLGLASAWIAR
ncbi:MAG: hisC [Nocardioidaceae bacterium]|nr:hisC [Nocardioidaceae bacterium]